MFLNKVKYCKLDERAIAPSRKNSTDAGLDLCCLEGLTIPPNFYAIVRTGISLEVPEGFVLKLWAKSRSDFVVGAGVIDSFYEPGEILVRIFNPTIATLYIGAGSPICQAVYIPIETPKVEEVSYAELENKTERSNSGGIKEIPVKMNLITREEVSTFLGEVDTI